MSDYFIPQEGEISIGNAALMLGVTSSTMLRVIKDEHLTVKIRPYGRKDRKWLLEKEVRAVAERWDQQRSTREGQA